MKRNFLIATTTIVVATILFSGCANKVSTVQQNTIGSEYPIKTTQKLTYWTNNLPHPAYSSYKEQPFFKQLEKETGVEVEFKFATAGQGKESFNLLIASNDLPDIVMYGWLSLPGGPQKYIDEKYIRPLNDDMKKYAPNLSKYLKEHPDVDRLVKTDQGNYYAFPFIRGDDWLTVYSGLAVRKDLLDKYNIIKPETIDDWYNMLKVFKNNGIKSPLSIATGNYVFAYPFDTMKDFYVEDGQVKYGPMESGWKDFITTFNAWYKEGLIDKDFGSVDYALVNQKMASGVSAASVSSGATIGTWLASGKSTNSEYDIVALKYPTKVRGEKAKFGQKDLLTPGWGSSAISATSKNVELATRYLDYAYGEKGHMLYNFGIEGESYEMKNGYPTFTQAMYDFKKGDLSTSISRYIWSMGTAPCIQDKRMYEQRLANPQQKNAIDLWSDTNMSKYLMPALTPASDESQLVAEVMNQVNTYVDESFYKSVCSTEETFDYEKHIQTLKKFGIDKVIKIYQDALGRYEKRQAE
jgi:putative aldouronate transport system substrate-binding protein